MKTENIKECGTQDCRDSPPQINFKVSKLSDLPKTLRRFNDAEHLVDVLLLTVDECEFLACYSYLKKPFRSFYSDIGYVYFGSMGNDTKETLKIALMRCFAGSFDPGGSLTVVKNGVRVLRPKAVFSIGACSGLNRAKVRLGDVVISSKPITLTHKNPASRCIGTLIRHAADGWNAPLENPDAREVKVHYCDCEILSSQEVISEDIIQQCPKAIALEIEHEGQSYNYL